MGHPFNGSITVQCRCYPTIWFCPGIYIRPTDWMLFNWFDAVWQNSYLGTSFVCPTNVCPTGSISVQFEYCQQIWHSNANIRPTWCLSMDLTFVQLIRYWPMIWRWPWNAVANWLDAGQRIGCWPANWILSNRFDFLNKTVIFFINSDLNESSAASGCAKLLASLRGQN